MRIKHTKFEIYKLYFKSDKFFHYHRGYSSKQSALLASKIIKGRYPEVDLKAKIVWCPYPLADDEKCITVYSDENEVY